MEKRIATTSLLIIASCLAVAACSLDNNLSLTQSKVTLSPKPLTFWPPRPLAPGGCTGRLLVAVPGNVKFDEKTLKPKTSNGKVIEINAAMTSTEGSVHYFHSAGIAGNEYVILLSDTYDPKVKYRNVSITSTERMDVAKILWQPDCK